MSKYNRTSENSSSDRLYHLERASPEERTGKEMFDWFRDPESPMFYNDYDNLFGTLHTFAYLFEEQKILTAIANGKVLELDMKNLDKYRKGKFEMKGFVSTTFFKNRAH